MEMTNPVHRHLFEEVTGPVPYIPKTDPTSLSNGIFVFLDSRPSYNGWGQPQETFLRYSTPNNASFTSRWSFPAKSGHLPVTAQEQLLYIFSFYGFSKTELSKIMNVSRPAVYAWLEGTEPEKEKQKKIKKMAQIAFDIDDNPGYPLFHEFINKPVLNHEKSLIDILSDKKKMAPSFPELVRDIHRLTKERRERMESLPKPEYTGSNSTLDYNLDSLLEKE